MKFSLGGLGCIGIVANWLVLFSPVSVSAAEIRFLCTDALESSMHELIPAFEKASGHSVKVSVANAGTIAERVHKEDIADLAIVLPLQWESLRQDGRIDPSMRTVIGKVG